MPVLSDVSQLCFHNMCMCLKIYAEPCVATTLLAMAWQEITMQWQAELIHFGALPLLNSYCAFCRPQTAGDRLIPKSICFNINLIRKKAIGWHGDISCPITTIDSQKAVPTFWSIKNGFLLYLTCSFTWSLKICRSIYSMFLCNHNAVRGTYLWLIVCYEKLIKLT